jgi:GNAT superfamily N-acetyltransferase
MQIRPALVTDAEGIAETNAAAWKHAFRGVANDAFLDHFDGMPDIRRDDLANLPPEAIQLVAVTTDQVIGWLAAAPAKDDDCDPESTFEIGACYVHPDHWRHGVGRELMRSFFDHLDFGQWTEVVLWAAKGAPQSHRFYESFDFRQDGKQSTIDRQGAIAIVRFRLSLSEQSGLAIESD